MNAIKLHIYQPVRIIADVADKEQALDLLDLVQSWVYADNGTVTWNAYDAAGESLDSTNNGWGNCDD